MNHLKVTVGRNNHLYLFYNMEYGGELYNKNLVLQFQSAKNAAGNVQPLAILLRNIYENKFTALQHK